MEQKLSIKELLDRGYEYNGETMVNSAGDVFLSFFRSNMGDLTDLETITVCITGESKQGIIPF